MAALKALEDKRKPWAVEVDRLRAERNANAKAVGMAKGRGEDVERRCIARGEALTAELAQAEAALDRACRSELEQWQLGLPNLLHDSVPDGRDEQRQPRGAPLGRAARASASSRAITSRSASALAAWTSRPRRASPARASS